MYLRKEKSVLRLYTHETKLLPTYIWCMWRLALLLMICTTTSQTPFLLWGSTIWRVVTIKITSGHGEDEKWLCCKSMWWHSNTFAYFAGVLSTVHFNRKQLHWATTGSHKYISFKLQLSKQVICFHITLMLIKYYLLFVFWNNCLPCPTVHSCKTVVDFEPAMLMTAMWKKKCSRNTNLKALCFSFHIQNIASS